MSIIDSTTETVEVTSTVTSVDISQENVAPIDQEYDLKSADTTEDDGFPVDSAAKTDDVDDEWAGFDFDRKRGKNDQTTIGIKKGTVKQK